MRTLLAFLPLLALPPRASAQTEVRVPGLTHVQVQGQLDAGTLALVHRAIGEAQERGDRLLLEIDTPGGEIELMWRLANEVLDADERGVPTVGWVNTRAWSAGALLALACERLYLRPHAGIGSAQVVEIGLGGLQAGSPDAKLGEKLDSTVRSAFRGIAERRGRPPALAEAMVDSEVGVHEVRVDGERRFVTGAEWDALRGDRKGTLEFVRTVIDEGQLLNATGSEAVALGLADGTADTLEELVLLVQGEPGLPTFVARKPSEDLASFLYSYGFLFLLLGLVFGYIEFKVPGFGIFGVLSVACFAVFLFGRYLVGLADLAHVLLIGAGFALLAAEIFLVPGTIWAGVTGLVLIAGGIVWSFVGPGPGLGEALSREIFLDDALSMLAATALALVMAWLLSRFLPQTPLFRRLALDAGEAGSAFAGAMPEARDAHARAARVGALGRALTALRPVGKVVLDADPALEFEARSSGAGLDAGSPVRVAEVQPSGRLVVDAVE